MTVAPRPEVVLTAAPSEVVGGPSVPGVRLVLVTTAEHRALLGTLHAGVPEGGGAVLAVQGARAVAAAAWTAVEHGTSELVGVVTVAGERRRGLGGLVVAAATAGAGAELVWLRTRDAGALRLYRAMGFTPTGAPG